MTVAKPSLVLFDFDGVLAGYAHDVRLARLARACGVDEARVAEVLFASGLEAEHDSGAIDADSYLRRLGEGLGTRVDAATWIAARVAAASLLPGVLPLVRAAARQARTGVLSNNGALLPDVVRALAPELFPAWDGCVLCSSALRARKPDPAIFGLALAHFGEAAGRTLFLDDKAENVEAARAAGLRAERVAGAASLEAALGAHGFALPTASAGAD